jgi:hypothetical protein
MYEVDTTQLEIKSGSPLKISGKGGNIEEKRGKTADLVDLRPLDILDQVSSWVASLDGHRQYFWDLSPSGCVEIFVQPKMFAVIANLPLFFPLFCPTKLSLGLFGPIFLWSRELMSTI